MSPRADATYVAIPDIPPRSKCGAISAHVNCDYALTVELNRRGGNLKFGSCAIKTGGIP